MALFQAVTVALIALILTPGYFFYFDITPKLVVLLLGAAVCVVAAPLASARPSLRGWAFPIFSGFLILNVLSLAVSTALSAHPGLSLFGTNWRRFGSVIQIVILLFAWLIAATCAGRPERVRTVLRGVTVAGAVSALYGIAQYFGWDPLLPSAAYHVGEGILTIVRPPGTLGYASYFATWLAMVVFLSAALRPMEHSLWWRRFTMTVIPVTVFALWLTGTRAALLALAAGGLVWFARRRALPSRRLLAAVTLAMVGATAFYYSPSGQQMRSRVRWFREDPWGGARGQLWRDSLRMGSARLAAGYGPETFTGEFPQFQSVELERAYPAFSHESPHNIFLDVLVAQGLPGVVGLLGLCVLPFTAKRHPGLQAALAAAVVSQQFTSFTIPTALIFFATVGLSVAQETAAAPSRRSYPLTAVSAVLSAGLLLLAVRFTVSDWELARTKRDLEKRDLKSAAASYSMNKRWRLPGGTADLWYSRAVLGVLSKSSSPAETFSAMTESAAAAREATQTAEDPFNAWYNLSIIYGLQNDGPGTERCLHAAIAAHPTWFKPHWMLAQVLRLEGRTDDAWREMSLALELDAGKDPEVARSAEDFFGARKRL